jgi:hypothetical protein
MDLTPILQPLEEGAVTAAGLSITAGVAFGLRWLSAHLAFLRTAAGAKMVSDANAVVQAAAQNASASIVAGIQSGRIDPTNRAGLMIAASDLASAVKAKVPDAIAILRPAEGAIAGMIADKALLAAIVPAPVVKETPVVSVLGGAPSPLAAATAMGIGPSALNPVTQAS